MLKTSMKLKSGDVVVANLNPTVGDEKQKRRPCAILEAGCSLLKLVIVCPITEDNGRRSKHLFVPILPGDRIKLSKPSVIDCYQIRTLSTERLEVKNAEFYSLGQLSDKTLDEVRMRLALILNIKEKHLTRFNNWF